MYRDELAAKTISHVQFGVLDTSGVHRASSLHVGSKKLFDMPGRTPANGGPLDRRLVSAIRTKERREREREGEGRRERFGFSSLSLSSSPHFLFLLSPLSRHFL
jgi:hypothetical protein